MAIYLNNEQDDVSLDLDFWQAKAEALAVAAGVDAEWSVTFVDDSAIHLLNRDYRGVDRPTDVLAFSQQEGDTDFPAPEEEALLGDVVIAVPTASRQATERGHGLNDELGLLLIHGFLHLLGEDHDEPERKAQMWRRQAALLAGLGFEVAAYGDEA